MNFYTNVCRIGNNICVREIRDGIPNQYKIKYEPSLFIESDKETEFRTLYGGYAKKIDLASMSEAKEFVKQYENINGFNIYGQTDYVLQFINETYPAPKITFDKSLISAWSIDIETLVPEDDDGKILGFPDVETADCEITIITMQNLYTKQCYSFGSRKFGGKADTKYLNCGSEANLLEQFVLFWIQQRVEVITGWNIEKFDMPYILRRIINVLSETRAKALSPWNNIEFRKVHDKFGGADSATVVDISGVAILDYLNLYKKFIYTKQESYSLNHIAQEELGFTKLDHSEYNNFNDFYRSGFDAKYVAYNVIDTQLVAKLEDKLKLIELAYTLAYMAKINYAQVFGPVKMWDSIIHNRLFSENVVIPLKETVHSADTIEGAYVKDPAIGFKKWVVSLDATSLYPSFMQTLNISPETYLGRADVTLDGLLAGEKIYPPVNECWGPTGARFSKDFQGVIPKLITEFLKERKTAKTQMLAKQQEYEDAKTELDKSRLESEISALNNLQMAIKISANSLYGAMANKGFRFFNNHVAETITLSGQYVLRYIEQNIDSVLNVIFKTQDVKYLIYIDTDSLYFELGAVVEKFMGDAPNENITKKLEKLAVDILQREVNKLVNVCADTMNVYDNKIFFKLEKVASAAIFIAKKRYAMKAYSSEGVTYAKPKIAAIGLDMVKSSTPMFVREKLKKSLELIFDSDEIAVREYIAEARGEFDKLSVSEIAFPRGVSDLEKYADPVTIYKKGAGGGTPMNARASLLYNNLIHKYNLVGKYSLITSGSKIRYVYLKLPNTLRENVIGFPADETLPEEFDLHRFIDYDLQWEKTMIDSLQNILDAIEWHLEEQSNLDDFFS